MEKYITFHDSDMLNSNFKLLIFKINLKHQLKSLAETEMLWLSGTSPLQHGGTWKISKRLQKGGGMEDFSWEGGKCTLRPFLVEFVALLPAMMN